MVITYNGEGYFKFQSGSTVVLLDPTNQRSFKGADIVLNTQRPTETDPSTGGTSSDGSSAPFWIDHAGEYEVGGIRVRGWQTAGNQDRERTIYRLDFDDFRFVCFGHLAQEPASGIIEHLENVDIAIIPAGGKPYISPGAAAAFVRQFEPAVVIPSLYGDKKKLAAFLKEFNLSSCSMEEKVTLRKSDVKERTMVVRCLKGS